MASFLYDPAAFADPLQEAVSFLCARPALARTLVDSAFMFCTPAARSNPEDGGLSAAPRYI
jgi:hypothetical protein